MEDLVTGDTGGDIFVVIDEFREWDNCISGDGVPGLSELLEDGLRCLFSALQLRVRRHIVASFEVGNRDSLAAAVVQLIIGCLDTRLSPCVQARAPDCMEKFIKTDSSGLGSVEVLHDIAHFILGNMDAVSSEPILEVSGKKEPVAFFITSSQEHSKPSDSIGWLLHPAGIDYALRDILEVGDVTDIFDVWVSLVQIFSDTLSHVYSLPLLLEVDVAVETIDGLCLVS